MREYKYCVLMNKVNTDYKVLVLDDKLTVKCLSNRAGGSYIPIGAVYTLGEHVSRFINISFKSYYNKLINE